MTEQRMIRVSVEVRSGTARFRVGVQARGVREALGLVGRRYPHGEVRLVFPVEPKDFFVSDPSVPKRAAYYQQTYGVAA